MTFPYDRCVNIDHWHPIWQVCCPSTLHMTGMLKLIIDTPYDRYVVHQPPMTGMLSIDNHYDRYGKLLNDIPIWQVFCSLTPHMTCILPINTPIWQVCCNLMYKNCKLSFDSSKLLKINWNALGQWACYTLNVFPHMLYSLQNQNSSNIVNCYV